MTLSSGCWNRCSRWTLPKRSVICPPNLQAIAFRLLGKDEAISVYEYLDTATQQSLLTRLRSGEMREVVEEMSPDDRVQLFDELPAKVVRQLLSELSPDERKVTAELLGYVPRRPVV